MGRGGRKPFASRGLKRLRKAWADKKKDDPPPSRRTSYRKWYSTPEWQKLRKEHLAKNPCCEMCLMLGRSQAEAVAHRSAKRPANVDHIQPHRGDWALFLDPSNLVTLCHAHHSEKTAKYDGGFGNTKKGKDDG